MARLYVHGHAVREYRKLMDIEGRPFESVYRLMSDGKFLRRNGPKWNLVVLKRLRTPVANGEQFSILLISRGYREVLIAQ